MTPPSVAEILADLVRSNSVNPAYAGGAGIPSVVGPDSIKQAHAALEWVDCAEIERAAEFYRRMTLEF